MKLILSKTNIIFFLLFFGLSNCILAQSERDLKLILAADEGNLNLVLKALLDSADINAQTEDGNTALMYASQNGHIDIVEVLIYNGANVNLQPNNGNNALFAACLFNHEDIVLMLLRSGANPNIKNSKGITALHYATAYGYYVIADMLLYYGADYSVLAPDSSTVLISAVSSGNLDVIQLILKKNLDINKQNINGYTALMIACKRNMNDIVDTLLVHNANTNIKNKEGISALDIAISNANFLMAERLISHGSVVTKRRQIPKEYIQQPYLNNNKEIIHLMKRIGVKQPTLPIISAASYGLTNYFNSTDYMLGFGTGLKDVRYKLITNVDIDIRVKKKYILLPVNDSLAYQYKERRLFYAWTIQKYFNLTNQDQFDVDFLLGIQAAYSHGNFKGSAKKFDQYLLSPNIGFALNFEPIEINVKWQYTDFKRQKNTSNLFFISLNWTIPLKDKIKNDIDIDWL